MIHTHAERLRSVRPASATRAQLHLVSTPAAERWPKTSTPSETGIDHLDAAAALGRDPFKTPIRLWMEKTGRQDLLHPVQPQYESLAYWSRLLEPIVAARYTRRTGRQVRRIDAARHHPRYPWMVATVTREVVASRRFSCSNACASACAPHRSGSRACRSTSGCGSCICWPSRACMLPMWSCCWAVRTCISTASNATRPISHGS